MTEYGPGSGSQPWHPEDPLYGDQGWNGGQQAGPSGDWNQTADPYGDPHATGGYGAQGQYPQDPDPYLGGGYPDARFQDGRYPQHGGPQQQDPLYQDPYHQGPGHPGHGHHHAAYPGHPDPGFHDSGYQQPVPNAEPYGQGAAHPGYGGREQLPHDPGATDPYGMQAVPHDAGPPTTGRGSGLPRNGPDPETGWDPGPDQGESSFFRDEDDDEAGDGLGSGRRGGRKRGGGKRRSGAACLVVVVLLGGVLAVAGWFGYRFYQSHFAAAPDFSGDGHGTVQVEIEDGSSVTDMAVALEKAGVIKSTGAFTEASVADGNKAQSIQPGVYTLRKEMSAEAAIDLMLDPSSQSTLIVPEGLRASKVFALIDERTGSEEGTTAKVAESADLGLPKWADGKVEGFLYPSRYSVTEKSDPADVLRKMVKRATVQYEKSDLAGRASKLGLDGPLDVLTVASLVQAEGKYQHDFVKVARVVYNRLEPGNTETNGYLQFDSTYNYAKNQSTLEVPSPSAMAKFDHPYNTYAKKGLPPGPINSPGAEALHAALEPAEGDWYYFVSITSDKTVFSETYEEHQRNVRKYEEAKE